MKSFLSALLLLGAVTLYAQSAKYEPAMKNALAQMEAAKSTADFQAASNTFERIGDAEKTQWLPYYYAGLCLATPGWSDTKMDKDDNALKIKALCDKAAAIENNADIMCLRSMAATQQMVVDPQNRWQTYGQEAARDRAEGHKLDPNNPRLYYLDGMSVFNTPATFGGGKANAKPIFEKAVALFNQEQPKPLYPNWGKDQAEAMLKQCQ